jgi:hypothetical protein
MSRSELKHAIRVFERLPLGATFYCVTVVSLDPTHVKRQGAVSRVRVPSGALEAFLSSAHILNACGACTEGSKG